MNKILIYKDKDSAVSFQEGVEAAQIRCNDLINAFESFQTWKKITTIADWIDLVTDPAKVFDDALISAVNLEALGGMRPKPAGIAAMFDIKRDQYMNLVVGRPLAEDADCVPCQKVARQKKGTQAITLQTYQEYADFLVFTDGSFTLNTEAIAAKKERFNYYAETPDQIEVVKHWRDLAKLLNEHLKAGHIGPAALKQFVTESGLNYTDGLIENPVWVNEQRLLSELNKKNN